MALNDETQDGNSAPSNNADQCLPPTSHLDVIAFSSTLAPNRGSMLHRALRKWLQAIPEKALQRLHAEMQELPLSQNTKSFASGHTVYRPMLQLPSDLFSKWPPSISDIFTQHTDSLYPILCQTFQVTHIALNGPIPASLISPQNRNPGPNSSSNVLRSPAKFHPVYGDFGPQLSPFHHPEDVDFRQAFWCTTVQNGISQIWAPRYTMFSRGNISEKDRILNLATLEQERLGCSPEKTSAVDLYAGIGYFAFSYAKANVGNVLCWEINPWSVEALRRGALKNRWAVYVLGDKRQEDGVTGERSQPKLNIFAESNERASERLRKHRGLLPVRHVNCGFLPTSQESWKTAVEALDPVSGGWVHAHENIAKKDIENRTIEIVQVFEYLVAEVYGPKHGRRITCEHLERVKSYSPHVIHCVLDIAILRVKTPAS